MLDLIGAYENYLSKIKRASDNTVASYMRDIRQYAAWLQKDRSVELADACQDEIRAYLSELESEGRSAATISRNLASLKNFYAYLVTAGFIAQTPVVDVHIDRGEKKLPQILTGREIEQLLAQPSLTDAKGLTGVSDLCRTICNVDHIFIVLKGSVAGSVDDLNVCADRDSRAGKRSVYLKVRSAECIVIL